MQVLIVDDDTFTTMMLERVLARMGYQAKVAKNGQEALDTLRSSEIRLVITDWDMPVMNGIELCRAIRHNEFSGYVYVIMLTGHEGQQQRIEGLCAGADDFLNKPLDPEELLVCLKTAERILSLETRDLALFALAKLAESRDSETGDHIERVQSYSRTIAQHLSAEVKTHYGVDEEYVRLIHQTSPLHDLGKVAIPDAVLLKPGKLTAEEFAIMKTHTVMGAQTLDAALQRFPNARFLQIAREIAASHHERFDGSGYPHGLAGDQIPLCGRIVALADAYDAMTSRRVYKSAIAHEQAKAIILKDRGSHFDPDVVDAFIRAETQILSTHDRLRDNVGAAVAAPVAIPATPQVASESHAPARILVCEDDPVLLTRLKEILAATGEVIFAASNGEEAMQIFLREQPQVVVSDWEMPGMNGLDLCAAIQPMHDTAPTHFIMLTAHTDKSRLLNAYHVGVDDFVSKPFDSEELLARVRVGLRAAKLRDDLIRKATGSKALNSQLAVMNSRLERLSITDELTGVFNRRYAMLRLEEHWAVSARRSWPLSVAMVDIDHFKEINDTHGHAVGDLVLKQVAATLRNQIRGTDILCRVGGEEFLLIFPMHTAEEALLCAERCRAAIAATVLEVAGATIKVTVSIGVAARDCAMTECHELLKRVDQLLYDAKHAGRNSVRSIQHRERDAAPAALPAAPRAPAALPTTPSPQVPESTDVPINYAETLARCSGDAAFAAIVSAKFEAQAPGDIAKMEQLLAHGDAETLRRTSHTLKSTAAFMAANAASSLAAKIEELASANRLTEVGPLLLMLRVEIERAVKWLADNRSKISSRVA